MKAINYPISLQYRKHWGYWESLREIYQNALDETGNFTVEQNGEGLVISDKGSGLAIRDLLFGTCEKDEETQRGRFGEGLKIALCVLKRLGHKVEIRSGKLKLETSEHTLEGERCLSIQYEELPKLHSGTKVLIYGYFKESFEDRIVNGQKIAILASEKDKIIDEQPTKLYVKNIYVKDLENAVFSYDLWDIRLEESRNIPSEFDVHWGIGQLWRNCTSKRVFYRLLQSFKGGKAYELDCHFQALRSHAGKVALKEAWDLVYGSNCILATDRNWSAEARWRGKVTIAFSERVLPLFKGVILTDREYVEAHSNSKNLRILDDQLNNVELKNLKVARYLVNMLNERYKREDFISKGDRVKRVGAYLFEKKADGKWIKKSKTIALARSTLGSLERTLDTTIHEAVHAFEGANDMTDQMILKLSKLAAIILMELFTDRKKTHHWHQYYLRRHLKKAMKDIGGS